MMPHPPPWRHGGASCAHVELTTMEAYKLVIDGKLVDGDAGTFELRNPANGESIGLAPVSSSAQVDAAVAAAKRAQPAWATQPDARRRELLDAVADVLVKNTDYLAKWI